MEQGSNRQTALLTESNQLQGTPPCLPSLLVTHVPRVFSPGPGRGWGGAAWRKCLVKETDPWAERTPPQPPPTWASLPPSGDCVGPLNQDGEGLPLPRVHLSIPGRRDYALSSVGETKARGRSGTCPRDAALVDQASSRPAQGLCPAAASLPFLLVPRQQPQVRGLSPRERAPTLPFSPQCCCHYGGLPDFPKTPWTPQPLLSVKPRPLGDPQPVLIMGLHPALGPIDQEWLGGSWLGGREAGGGLGGGEGGFATSEPAHLPSSRTAPRLELAKPGQWPQTAQCVGVLGRGPCTAQSLGPHCRHRVPGSGGESRPEGCRRGGRSCQEPGSGASTREPSRLPNGPGDPARLTTPPPAGRGPLGWRPRHRP